MELGFLGTENRQESFRLTRGRQSGISGSRILTGLDNLNLKYFKKKIESRISLLSSVACQWVVLLSGARIKFRILEKRDLKLESCGKIPKFCTFDESISLKLNRNGSLIKTIKRTYTVFHNSSYFWFYGQLPVQACLQNISLGN